MFIIDTRLKTNYLGMVEVIRLVRLVGLVRVMVLLSTCFDERLAATRSSYTLAIKPGRLHDAAKTFAAMQRYIYR